MTNKILDNEIIKDIRRTVVYIISKDLVSGAFRYASELEWAVQRNKTVLDGDFHIKSIYKKYILLLKYIAIPQLENEEIIKILKTNIIASLELSDYDLYIKIKEKQKTVDKSTALNRSSTGSYTC